ncbi:hypothetical protein L1987_09515 [Smallanthus sonchifolius]|uniref:Uncharacterized protein n=1 Tax=Smallanthus sonchifolius TaxID=185202 RepID=A0ACB9JNM3_9ASTR|nr:hypothetical protein L1987_09515 [Smallanthus sonchifolius]
MIEQSTNLSKCSQYALEMLYLGSNQLNGSIPESLGRLTNLRYLEIQCFTRVDSFIPTESPYTQFLQDRIWISTLASNSKETEDFSFVQCKHFRTSSHMVVQGSNHSYVDLSHNKLIGSLANHPLGHPPLKGFRNENTGSLLLQNNFFNGSIPRSLCRRTDLEFLDLAQNRLTGKIPNCVQKLQNLFGMIFGSNRLSGVIPSSIGNISSLAWLHLNDNNLNGDLPQGLRTLLDLNVLDLSNNKFSGKIPEWIAELVELNALRLHKNNLTGSIPRSLCMFSCLQILNLAHNRLKGSIPRCIGELSGMAQDLNNYCGRSYAYRGESMTQVLKGRIPPGNQLQTFTDPSIYAFNEDLCGDPLPKNCFNHTDQTTTTRKNKFEAADEQKKKKEFVHFMKQEAGMIKYLA